MLFQLRLKDGKESPTGGATNCWCKADSEGRGPGRVAPHLRDPNGNGEGEEEDRGFMPM